MRTDLILNEFDRIDSNQPDPELIQFCIAKFRQTDICDDQLIEDIMNEGVDDLDITKLLDILESNDLLTEVEKIKIKKHSTAAEKSKNKQYRLKNKSKLDKIAKIKAKKQASCGEGMTWSTRENKCIKKKQTSGLKKIKT